MSWFPFFTELVAQLGNELFLHRALKGHPLWLRVVLIVVWLVVAFALGAVLLLLTIFLMALIK